MPNRFLPQDLPEPLRDLPSLVLDLRWSTSLLTRRIWERLDPEGWKQTGNPYVLLLNAGQEQLEAAAKDTELLEGLGYWRRKAAEYEARATWFGTRTESPLRQVAYFSMEFGLSEALPIYSGGLGLLAGDHLKSAGDLAVPLVGVGLLYQQGYFRQVLSREGEQQEAFPYNDPSSLPVVPVTRNGTWQRVSLELPGRTLVLRAWLAQVGRIPLYLLDSNDPVNSPWDRGITSHLYDAGRDKRLLQEIVLGVGGWRLLSQLGVQPDVCHMNEGHAAFVVLARAEHQAQQKGTCIRTAFRATRAGNVFTTHTPVSAAFDEFDPGLVAHYAEPFVRTIDLPMEQLLALGRSNPRDSGEPFNMAFLAMRGCSHVNGVSALHGQVSRKLFAELYSRWPVAEIPVTAITNGVHIPTWNTLTARQIWTKSSGDDGWFEGLSESAQTLADADLSKIWEMRAESRLSLIQYIRSRYSRQIRTSGASSERVHEAEGVLDPNALTLGFARRFTEYKRPTLLLRDQPRLRRILLNSKFPVQLIVAGKAHPNDGYGKAMVREMTAFASQADLRHRVVFLEDYDITLAQHLAGGVDVWLNTPRRPAEACGTSGMKTLFNGGLNLSVRDGWWDEAWTPETGWEIGGGGESEPSVRDQAEAVQLLDLLEQQVIPEFYDRDEHGLPFRWLNRIRTSMLQLTARFSSDRMVKDYVEQAYEPAARAVARRLADNCSVAAELNQWHLDLEEHWHEIHFGSTQVSETDDRLHFAVAVYLGELMPSAVMVQLYSETEVDHLPVIVPMTCSHALTGSVNGFLFTADVARDRAAEDYTPRIIPYHPDAFVPLEASWIQWQR